MKLSRQPGPIDSPGQGFYFGGQRVIVRDYRRHWFVELATIDGFYKQFGPNLAQFRSQRDKIFVWTDGNLIRLVKHEAMVEFGGMERLHRHSCVRVVVHEGILDGGGARIARKKRRMNVQTTIMHAVQEGFWNELTVGHGHGKIKVGGVEEGHDIGGGVSTMDGNGVSRSVGAHGDIDQFFQVSAASFDASGDDLNRGHGLGVVLLVVDKILEALDAEVV